MQLSQLLSLLRQLQGCGLHDQSIGVRMQQEAIAAARMATLFTAST